MQPTIYFICAFQKATHYLLTECTQKGASEALRAVGIPMAYRATPGVQLWAGNLPSREIPPQEWAGSRDMPKWSSQTKPNTIKGYSTAQSI